MTTISNLGVGSGLDLNSLLASLAKAENAPLDAILKQQSSYNAKLSAYGQISSALSALQVASEALSKSTLFEGVKATSSATEVLNATAASTATSGAYTVNVTALAQAQSLAAVGQLSATAAIGGGTVKIEFGTVSGGTLGADGKYTGAAFAVDATRPAAVAINIAPNSTLEGIRDAINGDAASGVTASIINDGSATPNRLVLTSKQTGVTSSMRITVTGDAALSALLANNPAGLPAAQNLQQTVVGQNTAMTVNGIAVTSTTNIVTGAIQDVTMTVAKLGTSTVSVQKDTASVETAVATFVSAYNSLQSIAKKLTAYDAGSQTGSALLGDSTLRNIQVRIRSALTTAQAGSGGLSMLSNIGIAFQKDGTLLTDAAKLTTALGSQLSDVAKLFSGTAGVGGYGKQMSSLLTGFTGTDGMLSSATKGIDRTLKMLGEQYSATSDRIDTTMARYKTQFTQLDVLISSMNQTSSYLTQQFESLNNSSK